MMRDKDEKWRKPPLMHKFEEKYPEALRIRYIVPVYGKQFFCCFLFASTEFFKAGSPNVGPKKAVQSMEDCMSAHVLLTMRYDI